MLDADGCKERENAHTIIVGMCVPTSNCYWFVFPRISTKTIHFETKHDHGGEYEYSMGGHTVVKNHDISTAYMIVDSHVVSAAYTVSGVDGS